MIQVRDSGRERRRLDAHAEMCIRWLCPHARARRGDNPKLRDTSPGPGHAVTMGPVRGYSYMHKGEIIPLPVFTPPNNLEERDTFGVMAPGCRRVKGWHGLMLDDTTQDVGYSSVWLSGILFNHRR